MTPKRLGRPPLAPDDPAPSVNVQIRMPARLYDKSYQAARARRLTVPEWIRHTLQRATRRAETT